MTGKVFYKVEDKAYCEADYVVISLKFSFIMVGGGGVLNVVVKGRLDGVYLAIYSVINAMPAFFNRHSVKALIVLEQLSYEWENICLICSCAVFRCNKLCTIIHCH